MNPKEQQIAIARACGIDCGVSPFSGNVLRLVKEAGDPTKRFGRPVHDYLSDLNAMHEVEKVLTRDQLDTYLHELHELIGHNHIERYAVTATAAQRAEAFLRTLNLWTH